ncbi:multispanning membrane [Paraphaeosphaeria sporulosa]
MHVDVRYSALICALLAFTNAFYVPGVTFKSYRDGETIPLLVNKIYSEESELQFAYTELPFVCPPTGRLKAGRFSSGASISLNLGEVLRGDRITVSDYQLVMGQDEEAKFLCSREVSAAGIQKTKLLIQNEYRAEWIVDNLPGATSFMSTDKSRKYYAAGFKIGQVINPVDANLNFAIYNHVTLVLRWHRVPGMGANKGKKVIVGFEVYPKSISASGRKEDGLPPSGEVTHDPFILAVPSNATDVRDTPDTSITIPFTYSVYWREDEKLEWKHRWNMYFVASDDSSNVHWLAILNSFVIAGLLTAVVAVVFTRTIRGELKGDVSKLKPMKHHPSSAVKKSSGSLGSIEDIERAAEISDGEEEELAGWKLVHGDVFRAPAYAGLFSAVVGSGTQLIFATVGIIILSAVGVLNPSFRGGYISVGIGLWLFGGLFAGYFSSRLYRTFGLEDWQQNVLCTASLVPGLLFAAIFILNLFVWIQASSTALPFTTLVALIALWLFVQLPLAYIGGWYGYTQAGAYNHPIKANAIPRQVPPHSWYLRSMQTFLFAGFAPFMVMYIELLFVFKSLWLDKSGYYYVFGFMSVVGVILGVTVVEAAVVATYLQLCSENYHWWWQSFLAGSSSALWIFGYLAYYFWTKLNITGFMSGLLFFAYGALACAVYGLLVGTIGFLASYVFVRRIYAAVKVD